MKDHPHSPLLTYLLARLSESYFCTPPESFSSPLILIYQHNRFTDGIYSITPRLESSLHLFDSTAYRLFRWDVEVTETGLLLDVSDARFASSRVLGVGTLTDIGHNPRVKEVVQRVRYAKMANLEKERKRTVVSLEESEDDRENSGETIGKEEERSRNEDTPEEESGSGYVFPEYALEFLKYIYKL